MTISLFDHPHFKTLLGRDDLIALFSPDAEIEAMLRFEQALALAEADAGLIPEDAARAISIAIESFRPDGDALMAGIARDGLVVPTLIAALRAGLDESHRAHLHLGATSQDVIDTALIIRLKATLSILRGDIADVVQQLTQLADGRKNQTLMGRTRMQRALPIRLADRIGIWKAPLLHHLEMLGQLEKRLLVVQFGGPVGTLKSLGKHGPRVRAFLAKRLELGDPNRCWHTDRSRIVDLAGWLSNVNGSLGKIGKDVALMAQNEIGEAVVGEGGRSSAMQHKRNPVQAELLVALAQYNAGAVGTMHQTLLHEVERSGSAWALEWLTLPSMVASTGAALSIAVTMLDKLELSPG